jgi:hypothetical protein
MNTNQNKTVPNPSPKTFDHAEEREKVHEKDNTSAKPEVSAWLG